MSKRKSGLKIKIPSYPGDYVPMPEHTKRLILEAGIENGITYVDDSEHDLKSSSTSSGSRSTSLVTVKNEIDRAPTPEIRFEEPNDNDDETSSKVKDVDPLSPTPADDDSPIVFRRMLKRNSISAPDALNEYELDALKKLCLQHVSKSFIINDEIIRSGNN